MRIDELTRPNVNHVEAAQVLQDHGYARVGSGKFASVWAKPGARTVLKLFKSEDAAYLDFARFALAHQDNPHFPKLYGKLIRVTDLWRAVRMERLEGGGQRAMGAYLVERYLDKKGDRSSMMPDAWEQIQELFDAQPGLKEACDLLLAGPLNNHENDVCPDNVMFRGDCLVLTDPLAPKGWRAGFG